MALSKLAIGLIATTASVGAIGAITAGVVVSRQNSTQMVNDIDSSSNLKEKENRNNVSNTNSTSNDPFATSKQDKDKRGETKDERMLADQKKDKTEEEKQLEKQNAEKKAKEEEEEKSKTMQKNLAPNDQGEGKEMIDMMQQMHPTTDTSVPSATSTVQTGQGDSETTGMNMNGKETQSMQPEPARVVEGSNNHMA